MPDPDRYKSQVGEERPPGAGGKIEYCDDTFSPYEYVVRKWTLFLFWKIIAIKKVRKFFRKLETQSARLCSIVVPPASRAVCPAVAPPISTRPGIWVQYGIGLKTRCRLRTCRAHDVNSSHRCYFRKFLYFRRCHVLWKRDLHAHGKVIRHASSEHTLHRVLECADDGFLRRIVSVIL